MTAESVYKFQVVETATTNVEVPATSVQEAVERIKAGVEWFDTVRDPVRLERRPDGDS